MKRFVKLGNEIWLTDYTDEHRKKRL